MTSVWSGRNEIICPYIKKSMNYNPIFYSNRVHWIPNVIWSPDNVLAEIKSKDVDVTDVWKIRDPKTQEDTAEKFANLAMIVTI